MGWRVLERNESPAVLHSEVPDPLGSRLACVCIPKAGAVVIGSTQPDSDFDGDLLAAAGLELVRRRSGGGAVLVVPGQQVWLDVFVPAGDVLWEPDVGRSFHWLGEVYAEAIFIVLGGFVKAMPAAVHHGPPQITQWSKVLCFSGLGAGEVTVACRKVVGLSQRRTRAGAWIHSMALLNDRAGSLADLLSGSSERRALARASLESAGLPDGEHLLGSLTKAVLDRLP
jgi:lipoate-protein ligase A